MNSVISTFLRIAQVRHTKSYLDNITQTHPNKNNMLGLKQVLGVYGVDTVRVKYILWLKTHTNVLQQSIL